MSSSRWGRTRAARRSAVIAVAALAMLAPASVAQTPVSAPPDASHAAHIHAGTCAELGDVVVPLADVTVPVGRVAGASPARSLKISLNVVEMPLEELLAGEYAVNVHQGAQESDVSIACGDIGGIITPGETHEDELRFALDERNASGHLGFVFVGSDGDQTEVNITLLDLGDMD